MFQGSLPRERKRCERRAQLKLSPKKNHLPHYQLSLVEIDNRAPERRAKGSGIDHGNPVGVRPDAGAMGMAGNHEARGRPMTLRHRCRLAWGMPPRLKNPQHSKRRPDRIRQIMPRILEPVTFRLVPLRNGGGDPSKKGEPLVEVMKQTRRKTFEFGCDPALDERNVLTPGYDVVEEDIPVDDKHVAPGEIECVVRGEVRVVIAGEERGLSAHRRKKRLHLTATGGGVAG